MISFFRRNKPVTLDCFTYLDHAYDYAKINDSIKYVPRWWRDTPRLTKADIGTVKNCPAFVNFYKKGIVIPSWFEIEITVEDLEKNSWSWESSTKSVDTTDSHSAMQFEKFAGPYGHNIKLTSPWIFKTKEDIDFTWTQPTWSYRENLSKLHVLPSVINFKNQHATNINFFVECKDAQQKIKIDALTPLVILHGLTERKVAIKNHLVSKKEFDRIRCGINHLIFARNSADDMLKEKKRADILWKIKNEQY